MTQYIKNLTNGLIASNNYHLVFTKVNRSVGLKHIAIALETSDLTKMTPGTLGSILGDIEDNDIMRTQDDIHGYGAHTGSSGLERLRALVSVLLAIIITDRLDPDQPNKNLKPYGKTLE